MIGRGMAAVLAVTGSCEPGAHDTLSSLDIGSPGSSAEAVY